MLVAVRMEALPSLVMMSDGEPEGGETSCPRQTANPCRLAGVSLSNGAGQGVNASALKARTTGRESARSERRKLRTVCRRVSRESACHSEMRPVVVSFIPGCCRLMRTA